MRTERVVLEVSLREIGEMEWGCHITPCKNVASYVLLFTVAEEFKAAIPVGGGHADILAETRGWPKQ